MNQNLIQNKGNNNWAFERDETIPEYPQYESLVPQQDGQMKMVDWTIQNMNNNFAVMGQYDGPLNSQGLGEGQGTIMFSNGNRYVGQFFNGMKHGQGTFYYYDGSKFEGNYENDFRQGEGRIFFSDGSIVETIWVNDMMNGEGLCTDKTGKQKKCIFFNNTKIDLDEKNQDDYFQDCAKCHAVVSVCFYGAILVAIISAIAGQNAGIVVLGFTTPLYIANLCLSICCSSTFKYIFNIKQLSELRNYLARLKQAYPQVKFHITCYHYKRHRDKDGKSSRTKVTTLSKTKWFRYDIWCDRSQDIYALDHLQTIPYARLHIERSFDYSDRAANSLLCQRSILKRRYRFRDDHMDFSQSEHIDDYSEFIFINNDITGKQQEKPWASSQSLYILSTLFCLTFINKIAFIKATKRVDWQLNKYIIS